MQILTPITIDLINQHPLPILKVQQGNIGRGALVTLTANGAIMALTDETVTAYTKKPDGTIVYASASATSDGKVKVEFTSQMIAVPGKVDLELELINGTDYITTPIAVLEVGKSNIDAAALESSNEFSAFVAAMAQIGPASTVKLGTVKPDGKTITAAADGTITADPANTEIPFTIPTAYTKPTSGNLLKNILGNLVAGLTEQNSKINTMSSINVDNLSSDNATVSYARIIRMNRHRNLQFVIKTTTSTAANNSIMLFNVAEQNYPVYSFETNISINTEGNSITASLSVRVDGSIVLTPKSGTLPIDMWVCCSVDYIANSN